MSETFRTSARADNPRDLPAILDNEASQYFGTRPFVCVSIDVSKEQERPPYRTVYTEFYFGEAVYEPLVLP